MNIVNFNKNLYSFFNLEDNLSIICKRLKLKSEIEDSSYKNGKIKSKFFLPGFLPIYASIPDSFKEVFEDDYLNMKNNTFCLANGVLNSNIQLLAKDLKLAVQSNNNFDFIRESLSNMPKIIKIIKKQRWIAFTQAKKLRLLSANNAF